MSFLYAPSSGNTATSHTGSTFTASNGLGTATASTLTLSLAGSTASSTWSDNPRLTKTVVSNPWRLDAVVRLASSSGHDANTYLPFSIRNSSGDVFALIQAKGNGEVTVYDNGGLLATVASGVSFSGSEWFRLVSRDGYLAAFIGTGSSGSQSWTAIYRGNVTIPATAPYNYTYLAFNIYQGTGAAGTVTTQWADVQTSTLS